MASSGNRAASLLGTTLGRYEVQALIGRGAQGTVYLARDVVLNRNVALKVLLGNAALDAGVVQGFHREAQTAAGLRHPGIVRIYSAGVQDGIPYIAMEYVAGEPLDRFIKRHARIGWVSALYIGSQVADALACAHRNGIVHRDVKPANILLDREGRAHLTDFGIADATSAGRESGFGGVFAGTLHYTSPEQCAGGPVGPASDLYSLGVTLYRLISGELPFESDSPVVLIKKISTETPPRLNKRMPEVPDDVARLVAHLMEKQARSRPADAHRVAERIERIQSEGGGRSVIAEALAAFVKEQTETPQTPTPLPLRPSAARRIEKRQGKPKGSRGRLFGHKVLTRLGLAAGVCVILVAGVWGMPRLSWTPGGPPMLHGAVFEDVEQATMLVRLPFDGYRFTQLGWVGDRPVVLVRVEGIEGTMTHGAGGILAVDVESRKCWSVMAPAGPAIDSDFWERRAPLSCLHSVSASGTDSPLEGVLLAPVREKARNGRPAYLSLAAQKWDKRAPAAGAVFRAPFESWGGQAVPSPDGKRMCLVLNDRVHQSNYLAERTISDRPVESTGAPLTTMEKPIVSSTVQYSPDGSRIAYMRAVDARRRELWIVETSGHDVNGTRLAEGVFGDEYAFRPDGERLAVSSGLPSGYGPEILVLAAKDGATLARLGPGTVDSAAWDRAGEWVVVLAEDPDGQGKQLWMVDATGRQARHPVTHLRDGVRTAGAVSPTGRWVAAVAESERSPELVVVDLGAAGTRPERIHVAHAERE